MGSFPRAAAPALTALALAAMACDDGPRLPRATLSLEETLGGADTAGYARAVEPRPFLFPDDHGPHPAFRNEWWYVTGNLAAADGRALGFHFTLFRTSLSPSPREGSSAWATNQAYMAHFALTDAEGRRFHASERFARGALGLAGARARPFRVWLEDWELASEERGTAEAPPPASDSRPWAGDAGGIFPLRLRAAGDGVAVDLLLEEGKPPVLQGEGGLSRKGSEPGNASYYYSHTRMPASGSVILGADTLRTTGLAWLDREWSTSALSEGQVGWDWFALQLDHGWELMIYALRRADGSPHPLSDGVLVDPEGNATRLRWGEDVRVRVTGRWSSPLDGAVHPSGWTVEIPARGWSLEVRPVLADQELDLAFRYWEGAVTVVGEAGGRPVVGRGYVELTGYAGEPPER